MAEALDETLNSTLEDIEIDQMEQLASDSYFDNNTTCSCRGNCLRERGRNFCPCWSLSNYCSSVCHNGNSDRCLNNRRVQESDSDDSSVSVFVY